MPHSGLEVNKINTTDNNNNNIAKHTHRSARIDRAEEDYSTRYPTSLKEKNLN